MWIFIVISLGVIQCSDIDSMDYYDSSDKQYQYQYEEARPVEETTTIPPEEATTSTQPSVQRRYWLVTSKFDISRPNDLPSDKDEYEKDANLKNKIAALVEQTIHDAERKFRSIRRLKDKHKDEATYKIGFILSLVKKSKDVLNELYNVAIKHREDYKALEQLKIFEYIVHTNLDTTNLVRRMIEIHVQHMNSSYPAQQGNRVVLL